MKNTVACTSSASGGASRRAFLGRTLLVSSAMAAPALAPSSVLGGRSGTPPSERLNMAFFGLGGQGRGHLAGGAWTYSPGGYLARPDVQVRAVCDVRRDRREEAAQHSNKIYAERFGRPDYRDVEAVNDFREILARPDIDAVLLALPYHWAAPMSIMAMRQGKDVYCEKPVAITVEESRVMRETAERFHAIYQAGTQQRSAYEGKFRQVCELVRNGCIGELKEVYAWVPPGAYFPGQWTSDGSQPLMDGLDWDLWLGFLPWRPFNGWCGHALPGRFAGDINWGPHHYDFVTWVVDPDPTAPVEIEFEGGNVHYHYPGGVVVHSYPYPGENVGKSGGACFVGTAGRISVDRNAMIADPPSILKARLKPSDERVYFATSHADNFLECIRSRRPAICNPVEAARSAETLLTGGIAYALKRSLKWDPVRRIFPGDEEANRLLSYRPRPPWHL